MTDHIAELKKLCAQLDTLAEALNNALTASPPLWALYDRVNKEMDAAHLQFRAVAEIMGWNPAVSDSPRWRSGAQRSGQGGSCSPDP